jgi:dynein heavy chain
MSNEIIRRCCREINLDKLLDGHVTSGKKSLNDCIHCCEQWKDIYDKVCNKPSNVSCLQDWE